MKGLFKSKPRSPAELVRHARELLIFVKENKEPREHKREEKVLIPNPHSYFLFNDGIEVNNLCYLYETG